MKIKGLPQHGRVECSICYNNFEVEFDKTILTENDWRIKYNPLSWGNTNPKIIVLGFSKGPTQAGALAAAQHDEIAFKGSRSNVGKILAHIGLIPTCQSNEEFKKYVDQIIANTTGRFHFASLIRCTVERLDRKENKWKGSGGGMLDKFVSTTFGQTVVSNCSIRFLANLPKETKLIVMFGLGQKLKYVEQAYKIFQKTRPSIWKKINSVSYTDGIITVVHVEHFAAQGALIPNWLGKEGHERGNYGIQAQEAIKMTLNKD